MNPPVIIAHRGAPGRRQENTVAGFLAGVARGAEWVELDLHQTADGVLVVFHDFELGGKPIAQCTLEEVRRLARRQRRIELPTLEEVLQALPERVGVNVEIKAPGLGSALVSLLARRGATERVTCSSFHLPTVRALAELRPRLRTGLLTSARLLDPVREVRRARAQALCPEFHLADRELVTTVHRARFQVFVWTVNRETDLNRMLSLGVDGIITDFPGKLLRLRQAYQRVS